MAKLHKMQDPASSYEYIFICPGCGLRHGFRTKFWPMPPGLDAENQKLFANKWTFNGDMERPTIQPSLHVWRQSEDGKTRETICHSFVENGFIRFLSDCKHPLVNQTVEIPDWD